MNCEITGCSKQASAYGRPAYPNADIQAVCSDCYGYLSTLGLMEFVGSIRSEFRSGNHPTMRYSPTQDADTSPAGLSAWFQRPATRPWLWLTVVAVCVLLAAMVDVR